MRALYGVDHVGVPITKLHDRIPLATVPYFHNLMLQVGCNEATSSDAWADLVFAATREYAAATLRNKTDTCEERNERKHERRRGGKKATFDDIFVRIRKRVEQRQSTDGRSEGYRRLNETTTTAPQLKKQLRTALNAHLLQTS
jgi:hypothetical protein